MSAVRETVEQELPFDPIELDQVALFNALGLSVEESDRLVDAWSAAAPQATLNEFAKALVTNSAALVIDGNQ